MCLESKKTVLSEEFSSVSGISHEGKGVSMLFGKIHVNDNGQFQVQANKGSSESLLHTPDYRACCRITYRALT